MRLRIKRKFIENRALMQRAVKLFLLNCRPIDDDEYIYLQVDDDIESIIISKDVDENGNIVPHDGYPRLILVNNET